MVCQFLLFIPWNKQQYKVLTGINDKTRYFINVQVQARSCCLYEIIIKKFAQLTSFV